MTRAIKTAVAATAAFATLAPATAIRAQEARHNSPHVLEFFLGNTNADHDGRSEDAFTVGAQYRYQFSNAIGVGVLAEYARDPLDSWVVGVPVVFGLGGTGWQLTAMPGAEVENGDSEPLFRAGLGYEFEMRGGYTLKPEVNVDWVDGNTSVVAGISIGFRL